MHRGGAKRHHSARDDAGMSHDRDSKRRKLSRGPPHDHPYASPQSAAPQHVYGAPPQNAPPPHAYQSHPSNAPPPPYPSQGGTPGSAGGSRYGPPPSYTGPAYDRGPPPQYMGGRRMGPKEAVPPPPPPARTGTPMSASGPPPRGPIYTDHAPPASPYGTGPHTHHLQSPMSPTGSKRKPSIFHTPSQKSHGPPPPQVQSSIGAPPPHAGSVQPPPQHPIAQGGPPMQISPSSISAASAKKGSLQTRRDVQLNKISVLPSTPSQSTGEPEYGPRKPTKLELLRAIEKFDHDIAKLNKELSASRQSTVADSIVVDEEKYLQDPEIKRKPQMHQMFFSNFVKSIESHSKFDCVKYFPKKETDPEFPLTDETFWNQLYEQHREAHSKIAEQVTQVIKENVDRDKAWVRNMKKTFAAAQSKWLKANNVKPPPKDWLQLAAMPPRMKTQEEREFVFIDDNGFVEDPLLEDQDYYNKSAELSRWNDYEVEIFKQKYHIYPKNFRKISEFLPNKTVGDCINFYYHNKKDPILKHVIDEVKAKGSFQIAWAEGAATGSGAAIGAGASGGKPSILSADHHGEDRMRQASDDEMEDSGDEQYVFRPNTRGRPKRKKGGKETSEPEWTDAERAQFVEVYEAFPKDWKRIALTLQTKTVAQCKAFFAANKQDLGLGKSRRQPRGANAAGRRSTRSNPKPIVEEKKTAPPQASNGAAGGGKGRGGKGGRKKGSKRPVSYWTKFEKADFLLLLQKYGKDWMSIANHLETKTENQVAKHYQSLKKDLGLSVSDDEEDEVPNGKKRGGKKRTRTEQEQEVEAEAETPLPPDNDLRFFAEIASIKGSIDMNSDTSIEDEKEEQTYSTTTLFHSWITKKYLTGVVPTDQRPLGLELLAEESERIHEREQAIPDDIKPLVSRNNDALISSRMPGGVQYGAMDALDDVERLGYFWGDGMLNGDGSDDDELGLAIAQS